MSESFNVFIKDARDKPIITMMEMLRRQLMSRIQQRLSYIQKFNGLLCPKVQKKLEKRKVKASKSDVIYAGGSIFEVTNDLKTFIVDIRGRICTCRKWDVQGIPCIHGVAAICADKREPQNFVHECYRRETFVKAYSHSIIPIPDTSMWIQTEYEPLMPPPLRKAPGRPKKARKRAAGEPKNLSRVRKVHESLRCGKCRQFGHNSRTCKATVPNMYQKKTTKGKRVEKNTNGVGKAQIDKGKSITIDVGEGKSKGNERMTSEAIATRRPIRMGSGMFTIDGSNTNMLTQVATRVSRAQRFRKNENATIPTPATVLSTQGSSTTPAPASASHPTSEYA